MIAWVFFGGVGAPPLSIVEASGKEEMMRIGGKPDKAVIDWLNRTPTGTTTENKTLPKVILFSLKEVIK